MRKGFTMIELIFVIVIIGILAAVAIPKLAVTRADADGTKVANNLATCISDAGGAYAKNGSFDTTSTACTTGLESAGTKCFDISANDSNGTLTVKDAGTTQACKKAHEIAAKNNTSSATGVTHQF